MNLAMHTVSNKKSAHRIRVLLIENELHENETLKGTLESRGFQVHTLALTKQGFGDNTIPEPDIIILDSGNQLDDCTEMLQSVRRISPAPLLVLSSFDQPNVVARTLDCGADDFLTKPVSADILIAYINKLTRRARSNKKHETSGA